MQSPGATSASVPPPAAAGAVASTPSTANNPHYNQVICDICNKSMVRQRINDHIKIHFDPTYHCGPCGSSFRQLKNYQTHCRQVGHLAKAQGNTEFPEAAAAAAAFIAAGPTPKKPRPSLQVDVTDAPGLAHEAEQNAKDIATSQDEIQFVNERIEAVKLELVQMVARRQELTAVLEPLLQTKAEIDSRLQQAAAHKCARSCKRTFKLYPCYHRVCETGKEQVLVSGKRCTLCGIEIGRIFKCPPRNRDSTAAAATAGDSPESPAAAAAAESDAQGDE